MEGKDPHDQSFPSRNTPRVSQEDSPVVFPGSGSEPHVHHLQGHYAHVMIPGAMPYNASQHHIHHPDINSNVATTFNFYMNPSSSGGVAPLQLNPGVLRIPTATSEHVRDDQFTDGAGCSYEDMPSNSQNSVASGGSTPSAAHLSPAQFGSAVPAVDARPCPFSQFPGNSEFEPQSSMRNRPAGCRNVHFGQGIHGSQPFQSVGCSFLDERSSRDSGDGGTSTSNMVPVLVYLPGFLLQLIHPPPMIHGLAPRVPIAFHPVPGFTANYFLHPVIQFTTNDSSLSGAFGHSAPILRNLPGPYDHYMRALPAPTPRNRPAPDLRYVSINDEHPRLNEVRNSTDQHRDMRMDIDGMTYEDLLQLGEQLGDVEVGLPNAAVSRHLMTRTFCASATPESGDENDFCVICQAAYKNKEKIGTLDCGHECHAKCLKKWLVRKNVCPICQLLALNIGKAWER